MSGPVPKQHWNNRQFPQTELNTTVWLEMNTPLLNPLFCKWPVTLGSDNVAMHKVYASLVLRGNMLPADFACRGNYSVTL